MIWSVAPCCFSSTLGFHGDLFGTNRSVLDVFFASPSRRASAFLLVQSFSWCNAVTIRSISVTCCSNSSYWFKAWPADASSSKWTSLVGEAWTKAKRFTESQQRDLHGCPHCLEKFLHLSLSEFLKANAGHGILYLECPDNCYQMLLECWWFSKADRQPNEWHSGRWHGTWKDRPNLVAFSLFGWKPSTTRRAGDACLCVDGVNTQVNRGWFRIWPPDPVHVIHCPSKHLHTHATPRSS